MVFGFFALWLILYYRASMFEDEHLPSRLKPPLYQSTGRSQQGYDGRGRRPPNGPPPRPKMQDAIEREHYYNGDLAFYYLPSTLRAIPGNYGFRSVNYNILFAASSLKSLANLIPLACEMSQKRRILVHLAIMGRHDLTLDTIREINGVDLSACDYLHWHDARPDYAAYSTDARAEVAVDTALGYIDQYMHPKVLITDGSWVEEPVFVKALGNKCAELGVPMIELPLDAIEKLSWLSNLDVAALAAWQKPTVDILIQATTDSTGSLMRLLTSLYTADYSGLVPPRLIIELPVDVDATTQIFLNNFKWPPATSHTSSQARGRNNQLMLRHRIPNRRLSAEEASIRFFESFYPASTVDNHVLVLSLQAQVSPMYFHYLIYHILEYRYSRYASMALNLMGISLDLPTNHLNGTTAFTSPAIDKLPPSALRQVQPSSPDFKPLFRWQAPNSNAALYFGDIWIELHSFLSHRLTKFHSSRTPQLPKLISPDRPAWTEYFLEFMRSRGLSLLYPGFADSSRTDSPALVTMHTERFVPAEDFLHPPPTRPESEAPPETDPDAEREPFTAPATPPVPPPKQREGNMPSSRIPLSHILPFQNVLPDFSSLPHLSYSGAALTPNDAAAEAENYAAQFRSSVGGCTTPPRGKRRKRVRGDARDLFCYGHEEEDESLWERDPGVSGEGEDGEEKTGKKERDVNGWSNEVERKFRGKEVVDDLEI